jgi:hypothetical protein
MFRMSSKIIALPIDDPQRAREIANGFKDLDVDGERLQNAVGAINGKNIVIQKPHENGNSYVDRKGHALLN